MMRELKDRESQAKRVKGYGCSPNPYDEGTESDWIPKEPWEAFVRCSPNPYDEGTESVISANCDNEIASAAAQIPMMRELKDFNGKRKK